MIGIRREDKNRWERRVPLTPDHVAQLARDRGIGFRVQPSSLRAFPDVDYASAGAILSEELSECSVILGVKEIPSERLVPGKAHVFFPHVSKRQRQNMPMLARVLELGVTLVDFEQVVDDHGRRLIFFGRFAGYAGMIDALWALGQRLLWEGLPTPFERVRRAHEYSNLDEAVQHIARIGERLRHEGLPEGLRPLVFGFTGSGNVSRGAQEVFDRMPAQELLPEELSEFASDPDRPTNILYKVVFRREHRFERLDGSPLDLVDLAAHPERHRGRLVRFLPHLSVLIHGAFWKPSHLRIVTLDDLRSLWERELRPRLRLIADISCDIGGSIEATVRSTTPGDPVYVFDIATGATPAGVEGRGPVILAVDNLPCELPVEASDHFGDGLVRFVPALDRCDWTRPLDDLDLPPEIGRAIVAHRGALSPAFRYLEQDLERWG